MTTEAKSGRAAIFAKVRAGLGETGHANGADGRRRSAVEARLNAHQRHLVPARVAGKSGDELVAILRRWLEAASGELVEVTDTTSVPTAIATYLRGHALPMEIRLGEDPWLRAMPWQDKPGLSVRHGPAVAGDSTGVTHALAAIAETGTVLVASGPDNPVTLSFLPEVNIALVRRTDVVGPLEDAWAKVRAKAGSEGGIGDGLARTLNLISGPSRSADIGGVPVLGAHGPRRFCVMVVG